MAPVWAAVQGLSNGRWRSRDLAVGAVFGAFMAGPGLVSVLRRPLARRHPHLEALVRKGTPPRSAAQRSAMVRYVRAERRLWQPYWLTLLGLGAIGVVVVVGAAVLGGGPWFGVAWLVVFFLAFVAVQERIDLWRLARMEQLLGLRAADGAELPLAGG
jgi:hypothetical protein